MIQQLEQTKPLSNPTVNWWRVAWAIETFILIVVVLFGFQVFKREQQNITSFRQENSQLKTLLNKNGSSSSVKTEFVLPPVTGWTQFSDPNFSFTFEYPADWHVTKLSNTRIAVSNNSELCDYCTPEPDTYAFVIDEAVKLTPQQQTTESITYLCQQWVNEVSTRRTCPENLKVNGICPPRIGAMELSHLEDVSSFFPDNWSVARGGDWTGDWYNWGNGNYFYYTALYKNQDAYKIAVLAPTESWLGKEPTTDQEQTRTPQHPIIQIMSSLSSTRSY